MATTENPSEEIARLVAAILTRDATQPGYAAALVRALTDAISRAPANHRQTSPL